MGYCTPHRAAEVVAAIDVVANPGEAVLEGAVACLLPTYEDFRCAQDVGIAGSAKGVVDASVAQIDVRVAVDVALVAAAVEVLTLGDVGVCAIGRIDSLLAIQPDGGAVSRVVFIFPVYHFTTYRVKNVCLLADHAGISAAEDLHGIAFVQVHLGAAPYLGVLAIAAAEYCHGNGHQVLGLIEEGDAGIAVAALVGKDGGAVYQVLVDVDDDVAVHMSAVVAAAIDIAVQQTADTVVGSSTGPYLHEVPGGVIPLHGVPLRLRQARPRHRKVVGTVCHLCAVGCELTCSGSRGVVGLALREFGAICHGIIDGTVQAPGFYLQAVEGQFQTVLDFSALHVAALCVLCRSAADAALVGSIQPLLCRHVGIVAAAHHFVIDDDGGIKHHVVLAFIGHAAHVAAQEEAANVGGIGYVVLAVIKQFFFEGERRPQVHCSPFHVFGKYGGVVCQFKVSVVCGVELQPFGTHHVFTIVAQEDVVGNDMRAHLQLHERVLVEVDMCRIHLQRGTVTAAVDGATYDGGMLGILSSHHDGHLLGIGANGIQCIQRAGIVFVF